LHRGIKKWNKYIDPLLFAYREVPQESTGFAPFEMLYGRTVRGPLQILKELWTEETLEDDTRTCYEYVFDLREKLEETMNKVKEELSKSQSRYKHYFDKKTRNKNIKVGEKVLILLPIKRNKLLMQWQGPYEVIEIPHKNDFRVQIGKKSRLYHANLLKKYIEREENKEDNVIVSVASVIEENGTEEDKSEIYTVEITGTKNNIEKQVNPMLEDEKKIYLSQVLEQFNDVFSPNPGNAKIEKHKIQVTSSDPIVCKAYSVPFTLRKQLKEELENLLKERIIRKSNSPYASPLVIVVKKDSKLRICPDYRKLNKITIFDPEPMVSSEDLIQRMEGSQYFSTLDLSKGYWQVPMDEKDIEKTAFITQEGHFEFLRMPFGLVNSGATLVKGLRKILAGIENVGMYVDDIIVFSKTWQEHMLALTEVLRRLKEANMTVKPSKCTFGNTEVEFIGHKLTSTGITPIEENTTKILNAKRPTNKKEVQSFLGLVGYYRNYVPNFSAIAAPLSDLTKKGYPNKIKWTQAQENAYLHLRNLITKQPVLKLPDFKKKFYLRTDASNYGIGAILMQEHDGEMFPISYASKKLNNPELNYSTVEKECLAIIWAVKKFNNYLYGNEFILETDHDTLKYLEKAKFVNSRIMRWAMFLQQYRMTVNYIKGSTNCAADYLSRIIE